MAARVDLKVGIVHCEKVEDFVTREIFVDILESEEEHIDWLETNLGLIKLMGLQNFIQSSSEIDNKS
jgi:bacterioferritin